MIYLYYGKIGDGKTYHVVANELLPALYNNRKVYTNIDGLNKKHLSMLTGRLENELNIIHVEHPEVIKDLMQVDVNDKEGKSLKLEKGSMVIIDEAQMIWDAREFKDTKKGFLTLLEYHRHFGLDFVFITQNPKRLESSITRLANESYQVKNLGFLGALLKGRYVLHIRQTPLDREIISTIRGKYRPDIFLCYRSYVATAKYKKKTKGALQGFFYYATALVFILSVALFVIRGGFSFANPEKMKTVASTKKGGQDVRNDSSFPEFVYSDSPASGTVEVPKKEVQPDIVPNDDCKKYSGIGGNGYIRRGNDVLLKGSDGTWKNIKIDCSPDADAPGFSQASAS